MKLGDNVTMEAYNIWGDVPPRKCRPPKIGDIPKHTAIDEESPSSPISKSLTVELQRDSSLAIPFDTSRNIVLPLTSATSADQLDSSIGRFESKPTRPLPNESIRWQCPPVDTRRLIDKPTLDRARINRAPQGFTDIEGTVTVKLPSEESTAAKSRDREDSTRIPSSPEDILDQGIVQVRKDSALFLEEAEGLPALREILRTRVTRVIRPRRESSGYASNLGTFDEDRRNSSTTDTLQDSTCCLKERRRSSTGPKRFNSKLMPSKAEGSLTEDVEVERMPTTEIHRKVSAAELELELGMPNIEEAKEVARIEALVMNCSAEELSTRCRHLGDPPYKMNRASRKKSPEISRPPVHHDSPLILDISPLGESINRLSISSSSTSSTQVVYNSTASLTSCSSIDGVVRPIEKLDDSTTFGTASSESIEEIRNRVYPLEERQAKVQEANKKDVQVNILPRSIKMYQLLSTQSEDTTDGELRFDRRIDFEISKHDDDTSTSIVASTKSRQISLNKSSSVFAIGCSSSRDVRTLTSAEAADNSNIRTAISPGEARTSQRFLGDASCVSVRPIYPYCPYSPYGSPQGSPRNKRRPLRESRRVSIDNRQGALQLNQYKLLDNIGQGSYGIVKLVYNEEDETHYAMKILSKRKLMKKAGIFGRMAPGRKGTANPLVKVYREIALLKKLDHPNVVKLVEVLDDPDEDNLYLVFELVERGEILQVPSDKPLDEETARKNFRDVVTGVEYLHYQRIVHRDIKPSNLLVDSDGRIKIADLGVSAELRACGELLSGAAGTPAFAAPETTTPGAHYSGTLCDVWSMGVTLYCLVTGKIPWDGAGSIIGVQAAIRSEPLKFTEKPKLSKELCDFISKMLAKDPAERITLSEMKKHAWLTNDGAEPLPSEADNCRLPVTVTDEEVERVVTRIPKLDTLILIKTMLKQHSFQNPFLPKKSRKATCNDAAADSLELSLSGRAEDSLAGTQTIRNAKTERFQRTGRSKSAPDSYDWQTNGRQVSIDSPLPPVTETTSQETETEKR